MPYHIAKDRNEMSFEEFDEDFADTAVHLLDKYNAMVSKYRALLMKDSMVRSSLILCNIFSVVMIFFSY